MTLVSIPSNPVPENPATGMVATPDGRRLRFAYWTNPVGSRGTVCVFTGRSEYIEKYFETVRELRARGFCVAMIDWRGQGHSSRQLADPGKGHVEDFSEYEIDAETFMQQVVLQQCPPPYFALAHSMGGAAMLRVAHSGKMFFERMVLCAPLIDLPPPRASRPLRWLTRIFCAAGLGDRYVSGGKIDLTKASGFAGNRLTSDPDRYARNAAILKADPSLGISAPTVAWLDAVFATVSRFREAEYATRIHRPVLMIAGGHDTIVSTPAIVAFARRLPAGSHRVIAGAKHEILHERDLYRAQFWDAFDEFIGPDLSQRSG